MNLHDIYIDKTYMYIDKNNIKKMGKCDIITF